MVGLFQSWRETWVRVISQDGVCLVFFCEVENGMCCCKTARTVGISFFSFPKERHLRKAWIDKVKRRDWLPSAYSRLCAAHFEPGCFEKDPTVYRSLGWDVGRQRLKPGAVPTIFDYSKSGDGGATNKREPIPRGAFRKRRRMEVISYCVGWMGGDMLALQ